MKKENIIKQIAESTGVEKVDVRTTIEAFMNSVKSAFETGEAFYLRGFGNFVIKERDPDEDRPFNGNKIRVTPYETDVLAVEEPAVAYAALEAPGILPPYRLSKSEVLSRITTSPSSEKALKNLMNVTQLPLKTLADNVFEMTPKTLSSYKQTSKKVPTRMAELIIKLEELYLKGNELFSTPEKFNKWMNNPAYGLGGEIPLTLINSATGIDLIMEELLRIEFGATA